MRVQHKVQGVLLPCERIKYLKDNKCGLIGILHTMKFKIVSRSWFKMILIVFLFVLDYYTIQDNWSWFVSVRYLVRLKGDWLVDTSPWWENKMFMIFQEYKSKFRLIISLFEGFSRNNCQYLEKRQNNNKITAQLILENSWLSYDPLLIEFFVKEMAWFSQTQFCIPVLRHSLYCIVFSYQRCIALRSRRNDVSTCK